MYAGSYKIEWYYEYNIDGFEFDAMVEIDNSMEVHHICWKPNHQSASYRYLASGNAVITLSEGRHDIQLIYRAPNGGEAIIYKSYIKINSYQ